ncbi:sugar ABC transporter permease [Reticulibacter mediterranei]|uniref:Sugar ABC transporter permease n=1 Tax=Reticulibacter mediterranei TaxID=2778369 RepID=A0A8J3IQ07_9CHLR|nr:sugar ABC transporter permease [Reticulibacter mediterranei]GHO96395.1 sugar ABC transporter permease [Reticulibacter mediterranei]
MEQTTIVIEPLETREGTIPRKRRPRRLRQFRVQSLFLLPALVIFTAFVIYPLLGSLYYSLTDWDGLAPDLHFVGLANFQQLLSDPTVLTDLKNTLVFAAGVMVLQNGLALLFAIMLDGLLRRLTFLRVLFLIPAMLSALAIGYIWSYIYTPEFGFLNTFLGRIGLATWQQDWLGNAHLTLTSLILTNTWEWTGFSMVIFLAGLQAVPGELYEAANIDGTSGWQRFRHITFPLIAPSVTVNVVLTLIGSMKVFDLIFVMTNGGPGDASESLALRLYKEAFTLNHFGYGTAVGIVMSVLILALSVLNLRLLRKREVEL